MARPAKTERNLQVVYDATVEMLTVREISEKYSISESRVYQILKDQAQHDIPDDVHIAMHALGLQKVQRTALEIMESDPVPTFDVKGNPLIHPVTGQPVVDETTRLKAMDMWMRAERSKSLLYARDAPRRQEIILSEQRSQAQDALDALRVLVLEVPDQMRQAVIQSDMKAIEGQVESP